MHLQTNSSGSPCLAARLDCQAGRVAVARRHVVRIFSGSGLVRLIATQPSDTKRNYREEDCFNC